MENCSFGWRRQFCLKLKSAGSVRFNSEVKLHFLRLPWSCVWLNLVQIPYHVVMSVLFRTLCTPRLMMGRLILLDVPKRDLAKFLPKFCDLLRPK